MRFNPNINLGRMKVSSLLTWILKVALSLLMLFSFLKRLLFFFLSFWIDFIAIPASLLFLYQWLIFH